jgi:hypothetical protein
MRVEEAIYGEVNGGHALRSASGNKQFALSIASRLDLPDNSPVGVRWSPYVSGFAMGDHYIIARTFIDESAPRSGMVFSHALIVSLKDILEVQNFHCLFSRLANSADQINSAVGYNLEKDLGQPPNASDLVGAANALTSRGTGPIIRLGTEGFETLVASLWASLWPEARLNFGFRLSFGPTDVIEKPAPILICTPTNLAARWSRFRILNAEDQIPNTSSACLLVGKSDPIPILSFGREIGANLQKISELSLLELAHCVASRSGGLDDILTAVRLIDKISPNPTKGLEKKKVIISHLERCIESATPNQILSMRNLSLLGFPMMAELWKGIEDWFVKHQFSWTDDSSIVEIIECTVNAEDALEDWQAAVKNGLNITSRSSKSNFHSAIWRWLFANPNHIDKIFSLIPRDTSVELLIAESTPEKLPTPLGEDLLLLFLKRSWIAAHGAILSALKSPLEAVRKQLEVDSKIGSTAGIKLTLRFASPTQIFNCAIKLKDQRLINLAADKVILDPTLLEDILADEIAEQEIWDIALHKNSDNWCAPKAHLACRDKLLEKFLSDEKIHQPLLMSLSSTPLADLCSFEHRERIWEKLEANTRNNYVNATAEGWLNRAAGGELVFAPDRVLESAIVRSHKTEALLTNNSLSLETRINIIEVLSQFDEHQFVNWLHSLLTKKIYLSHLESERIGRLVYRKNWQRALQEIVARYRNHRNDLKPALRACSSMLGRLTRWSLSISAVPVEEKWDAFAELAAQLYSSGPEHDEIWSRAGGDNSDLQRSGSGKSMWLLAFAQIRNGRGPSPTRLLNEMKQDYSANEELRFIASDTDITGTWHRH